MIRKIRNFQQMYTPELTLNGKFGNSSLASYIEHLILHGCHWMIQWVEWSYVNYTSWSDPIL